MLPNFQFRISIGFDESKESNKSEHGLLHKPNLILKNHENPMLRSKSQTNPHHHREYVIPREMWDIFAKSFMSAKKRSDENTKSEVTTEKSGPETEAKTSPVSENPITETKNVRLQNY